jgi:hypothetical protein
VCVWVRGVRQVGPGAVRPRDVACARAATLVERPLRHPADRDLGLLSHLEVLQLTFNRALTGTLPSTIGQLTKLRWLYAWNASLESIPEAVGGLRSLERLDMMDNALSGALPSSLSQLGLPQLARADTVYLGGNRIRCPLAPALAHWLETVEYHGDPCA